MAGELATDYSALMEAENEKGALEARLDQLYALLDDLV